MWFLRCVLASLLILSLNAWADLVVEADGSASIINGDLISARRTAIAQAAEAAAMRSSAYISSTSIVRNGAIEIDNVRMTSLGRVSNIQVINERVIDNVLFLRIRADVSMDEGCSGDINEVAYHKKVAFTAFPLQYPLHANTGGLHKIVHQMPDLLAQQVLQQPGFDTHLATHITLHPNLNNAPTQTLDDGMLTNIQRHTEQTQVQYIVSGVIRDMQPLSPIGPREPNILVDLYHRMDQNHARHQRNFVFDLFIHDALTGALFYRQSYSTSGRWNAGQKQTGFATQAFWQEDYGIQVLNLLRQASLDIRDQLRCQPFSARITRAENDRLWINAGAMSGLKAGDRLSVYRRMTYYDPLHMPYAELNNTHVTLTLDNVQPNFASGRINDSSQNVNIQVDDIVRSH